MDGALALSLVIWPPKGSRLGDVSVPLGPRCYPEELKAEIRQRHAAGETIPELARKTGIPFGSVKSICGCWPEKRKDERQARRLASMQEEAKPV
jgi:hypothetical protein